MTKLKFIYLFFLSSLTLFGQDSISKKSDLIIRDGLFKTKNSNPIYIVNSRLVNESLLKELDPNSIEKIDVLKSQVATAIYGQNAQNGVIVITTKDISKKIKRTL